MVAEQLMQYYNRTKTDESQQFVALRVAVQRMEWSGVGDVTTSVEPLFTHSH